MFAATDTRPKRFVLRSLVTNYGQKILDAAQPEVILPKKLEYLEKDLHPFLVYYGFHYLKAYLKTIRHNRSDKKEFGE